MQYASTAHYILQYINILKSESYYFENFPELFNHKYLKFKEFFYEARLITM